MADIRVIITPMSRSASLLARPPLMLNGRNYPYQFDVPVKLPAEVVEIAERADSIKVERVVTDAADGAAAETVGVVEAGGPDTPPEPEPESEPEAPTQPATSDEEYRVPDGYSVTEKGGGYYEIEGPEGFETVKVRGKDALVTKLAELA